MKGKETCKILKRIRRDIAKANDIGLTIADCKHKGDCAGTCPRCEAEVQALERALADRRRRGLSVTLAGISAGVITAGMVSCDTPIIHTLEGDMRAPETDGIVELAGDIVIEETATAGVMLPPESVELDGEVAPPDTTEGDEAEVPEKDEASVKANTVAEKDILPLAGLMPAPEESK